MTVDLYRLFCTNVEERLRELGWTRADLAAEMGVTKGYITQILNAHRRPGLEVVARCAEALGMEPSDLLRNLVKSR